jgi:hypothetical protein
MNDAPWQIRVQGRLEWLKSYHGQQNPPRPKTRTVNKSDKLGASHLWVGSGSKVSPMLPECQVPSVAATRTP